MSVVDAKSWQGGRITETPHTVHVDMLSSSIISQPHGNVGARRTTKDKNISPEEEEKKIAMRKEKRRMQSALNKKRKCDNTNNLMLEFEGLQDKNKLLENKFQQLKIEKMVLEYLTRYPQPCCCKVNEDIKFVVIEVTASDPSLKDSVEGKENEAGNITKMPFTKKNNGKRPTTLSVPSDLSAQVDGISITTPTNGMPFDLLLKEFEGLQDKNKLLENEIQQLQMEKSELKYLLENHRPCCSKVNNDIKCEVNEVTASDPSHKDSVEGKENEAGNITKMPFTKKNNGKRPTTLSVPSDLSAQVDGISITTPTNGMPLDFDSLLELDGLYSGVPTRTTATLNQTNLRNIEQTFQEWQPEPTHDNQARFVPSLVQPSSQVVQKSGSFMSVVDTKSWQGGRITKTPHTVHVDMLSSSIISQPHGNVGARRPTKDKNISPEEEEKKIAMRKERKRMQSALYRKRKRDNNNNLMLISPEEEQKIAMRKEKKRMQSALYRKRKRDYINNLILATESLEDENKRLEDENKRLEYEFQHLTIEKIVLEYLLEDQPCCCKFFKGIKCEVNEVTASDPSLKDSAEGEENEVGNITKMPFTNNNNGKRPTTLSVPSDLSAQVDDGISITTPTSGMSFNFDSLLEVSTGLSPFSDALIPSCATSQDLSSPDFFVCDS